MRDGGVPIATGTGAFVGLLVGMAAVAFVATATHIEYLWLNLVGAVVVTAVGVVVSVVTAPRGGVDLKRPA